MAYNVIGTAGHIDHGKTALVKALTGIDADRLKEEKERRITIDLGFAFLNERIAFVDVPGHERFVKNMVAGVTGIDLALLVVAADDGIMPQTREHLDILRLLKIRKMVVALTKTDLVDEEWIALVAEEIRALLTGSEYESSPVVAISSVSNDGIEELKSVLISEIESIAGERVPRPFRMPVDRAFTMTGFGTVITGTVTAGELTASGDIELLPAMKPLRIRGLQSQNTQVEKIYAGERAAINITGVQRDDIRRGDVAALKGHLKPSRTVNCFLHYLPSAEEPLKYRERVRFHSGAAEIIGRVVLLDRDSLEPGGNAPVQIQLEKPVAAASGDRFIVRRYSPLYTIGGGEILETDAAKPKRNRRKIAEYLVNFNRLPLKERITAYVTKAGINPLSTRDIARQFSLHAGQIEKWLKETSAAVQPVHTETGCLWIGKKAFDSFTVHVTDVLDEYHRNNPAKPGMNRLELVKAAGADVHAAVWKSVIDSLADARRIIITKDKIKCAGFTPAAGQLKNRLLDYIRSRGVQAPTFDEAADELGAGEPAIRSVVDVLVDEGSAAVVEKKFIYPNTEIERVKAVFAELAREKKSVTLGEFRTALHTSRKYALPLLDYFDETGFTARVGDARVLV